MKCEYCNTEFQSKSALNNHKNKAKYCLILQGKIKPKEEVFNCNLCEKILSSKQMLELHKEKCEGKKEKIEEFKCKFCSKILSSKQKLEIHMKKCEIIEEKDEFKCEYCDKILSTKQMLENHKNICIIKKDKEIEILKKQLESKDNKLKEQLQNKDKECKEQLQNKDKECKEQLEKQEEKYEDRIKDLQDKLENLASKAIERPTSVVSNTTTNNSLNIATSMDFDNIDHIKNLLVKYLTINHIVDGQKGIANFVRETMLTDDNGIPKYVCTDPSRYIFKYKDTNGEIKKDVEAKKLTGSLIKGGIRKQTAIIGNEWVESEENSNDYANKLGLMMEFQENIHKLGDNNTDFRKELVAITS